MKLSGLLLSFLFILSVSISGQILNRGFEQAVIPEPNTPPVYPLYWEYENYAGIHHEFYPDTDRHAVLDWSINEPNEGDYFLVMTTGNLGQGSDPTISKAQVWQEVFLPAWTMVRGVYFFGTSDYRPYYDFGAIELVPVNTIPDPNDPNNPCDPNDPNSCPPPLTSIELVRCSVNDVGDFGSTEDWVPFSYTITPQQEGTYNLLMYVRDGTDYVYESFFAVDNLSVCGPKLPLGDLTRDCIVNMDDLAFLSREWLHVCYSDPNFLPDPNDPNYISDPNDPNYIDQNNLYDPNCLCADLSGDEYIDVNDLYPIQENWLFRDL